MPKPLNCTDIALFFIPKKANTTRVTGYRPIDLTNIVYRIIAKSLANRRLKEELHDYTQGRRITGNIIIVQETIHSFNLKSFAQHVFMLKIDIATVFDHIEWLFVLDALRRQRHDKHLIRLIHACISIASFAINVNVEPYGHVSATRGVLERDVRSHLTYLEFL